MITTWRIYAWRKPEGSRPLGSPSFKACAECSLSIVSQSALRGITQRPEVHESRTWQDSTFLVIIERKVGSWDGIGTISWSRWVVTSLNSFTPIETLGTSLELVREEKFTLGKEKGGEGCKGQIVLWCVVQFFFSSGCLKKYIWNRITGKVALLRNHFSN